MPRQVCRIRVVFRWPQFRLNDNDWWRIPIVCADNVRPSSHLCRTTAVFAIDALVAWITIARGWTIAWACIISVSEVLVDPASVNLSIWPNAVSWGTYARQSIFFFFSFTLGRALPILYPCSDGITFSALMKTALSILLSCTSYAPWPFCVLEPFFSLRVCWWTYVMAWWRALEQSID